MLRRICICLWAGIIVCCLLTVWPGYAFSGVYESEVSLDGCQVTEPLTQGEIIEQKFVPLYPKMQAIHLFVGYDETLAEGQFLTLSVWDKEECLSEQRIPVSELGNVEHSSVSMELQLKKTKEYIWRIDTSEAQACQLKFFFTAIDERAARENQGLHISDLATQGTDSVVKYEYRIHLDNLYVAQLWLMGIILFFCGVALFDKCYSAKYKV